MEKSIVEKAISIGYNIVEKNINNYRKRRYLFEEFSKSALNKGEITEVVGLRGAGKTVMISQFLEGKNYVYINMNYPGIAGEELYDLLEYVLTNKGAEYIVLDEFQHSMDFSSLKIFFDSYRKEVKLIITGSSALALKESRDRRIRMLELKPMSFREFLYFKYGVKKDKIGFEEIIEGRWKDLLIYDKHLQGYYRNALPFLLEGGDKVSLIESILRKDLPVFRKLNEKNIKEIEKLMHFIANSLGEFSFSSSSKSLGIAKSQISRYIDLLKEAELILEINPDKRYFVKEKKFYYKLPIRSILMDIAGKEVEKGIALEEFFVNHCYDLGLKYISGKKNPDFLIDGKSFEVGGRAKTRKQKPDYLVVSGRSPGKKELPLVAFGFLY